MSRILPSLVALLLAPICLAKTAPRPCPNLKFPRKIITHGRIIALELQTRMDVDVDGAPNAYGPPGKPALDIDEHGHALPETGHPEEIVGYILQYPGGPPKLQGPNDPYPGYYISQTTFEDKDNPNEDDPRRYVDATKINYVVLGRDARQAGVQIGDFASVYSCRTGKRVWAIVADSGNESGSEGSLALVRDLGYIHITNGIDESINRREIVIRYYPHSNPQQIFFKTQADLNFTAEKLSLLP
jgi:Fungal chitosanase of glycosyl hydrolase group 75